MSALSSEARDSISENGIASFSISNSPRSDSAAS